ncbi:MAG: YeeE/YedE family protein [Deltaproteobacteria bacterium]|nr:YeeE/YedE family protein [Deltaproteobacteria bacterium]MBW2006714.1 YeeE/YedE family protein [Deltaproteobacteria bacterium]
MNQDRYSNPYVIGFCLGLVLLFSFYTMGRGVGSSASFARIGAWAVQLAAPEHAANNAYLSKYTTGSGHVLKAWLVFLTLGACLGGLFSGFIAGRIQGEIARGPSIGTASRLWLALFGGVLSGFAARLARGCTSGQALTGASELALGSWIFMFCIFGGAYATAYFFRKEWL